MFNADIVFLGSGGFSTEKGVTTGNVLEVELKRTMVKQSEKVILTADSSKYGRTLSIIGLDGIYSLSKVLFFFFLGNVSLMFLANC